MHKLEEVVKTNDTLPLNIDDHIVLLPQKDIIMFEVSGTTMTIHTNGGVYQLKAQLKRTLTKLSDTNFVQISKNTVINLHYLDMLETSFSGNMMAKLTDSNRALVSRKYLPELKKHLGM